MLFIYLIRDVMVFNDTFSGFLREYWSGNKNSSKSFFNVKYVSYAILAKNKVSKFLFDNLLLTKYFLFYVAQLYIFDYYRFVVLLDNITNMEKKMHAVSILHAFMLPLK